MTSVLNVDTIADKAGGGTVKVGSNTLQRYVAEIWFCKYNDSLVILFWNRHFNRGDADATVREQFKYIKTDNGTGQKKLLSDNMNKGFDNLLNALQIISVHSTMPTYHLS